MSDHAHYSPSSFDRVIECPGSLNLSKGMPNRSSKFADEGTQAHAMAASILEGHLVDARDWPDVKEPDVMLDHVLTYTGHVQDIAWAPANASGFSSDQDSDVTLVEQRVKLNDEMWGTADAIVWRPAEAVLYVRDLKYGAGIAVEVDDNTQLKIYALMALLTFKYPARYVDIGIVQPRCPHHAGPIRTIRYEAIDLLDFWSTVEEAVIASKAPDAPLCAGDHCRFCPAAPVCPEIKSRSQAVAKAVFSVGVAYTPADLAKTLDMLPVMEAWIKNVREFAYAEAEQGRVAPGYKLVEKAAIRKWRSGQRPEVIATLLDLNVSEVFEPPKMLGVTALQKLAPGSNDKERAAAIEPFVERVSSGHVLAHDSDKRPAVRIDAKAAFTAVPLPMDS